MKRKPLYRVRVVRSFVYEIEVRGSTPLEAARIAKGRSLPSVPLESTLDAEPMEQIEGPWVYGGLSEEVGGRPDGYRDTKDLLVFSAPHRRFFSEEDVSILVDRARRVVGAIKETYNGTDCITLSIRMEDPFGTLSDQQVEALLAPKESASPTEEPSP